MHRLDSTSERFLSSRCRAPIARIASEKRRAHGDHDGDEVLVALLRLGRLRSSHAMYGQSSSGRRLCGHRRGRCSPRASPLPRGRSSFRASRTYASARFHGLAWLDQKWSAECAPPPRACGGGGRMEARRVGCARGHRGLSVASPWPLRQTVACVAGVCHAWPVPCPVSAPGAGEAGDVVPREQHVHKEALVEPVCKPGRRSLRPHPPSGGRPSTSVADAAL